MKRIFLGIALSDEARQHLVTVQDRLRAVATRQGVRFVPPTKLHLTLAFLDSHPEEQIQEMEEICRPICGTCSPFRLSLQSIGGFPGLVRPKVLWAGIAGELELLLPIQNRLSTALAPYSKPSADGFTPHVTLARIVPGSPQVGRAVQPIAEELQGKEIANWRVSEILLYESAPDGRYEVLRAWPLADG